MKLIIFLVLVVIAVANPVSFLLLGDWGLPGYNQSLVAGQMSTWAANHKSSFVVALGDNFYCK